MPARVIAGTTASVSELKRDPMGTVQAGDGEAVAILNRNRPVFYCVPATTYEQLLERLEDIELNAIADARREEARVPVDLDAI
jgi:antitoxin StbD